MSEHDAKPPETLEQYDARRREVLAQRMVEKLTRAGIPAVEIEALLEECPDCHARDHATAEALRRVESRRAARSAGAGAWTLHARPSTLRARLRSTLHAVGESPAAGGTAATILGVASAYNVLIDTSPTRTIIKPGAFAASLADPEQRKRLRLLFQHDPERVIGRIDRVTEHLDGLHFTAFIADTQLGQDVGTLVKTGALREISIGFDDEESELVPHGEGKARETVREVTRARLWEISVVTWGANVGAVITDAHRRGAPADPTEAMLDAEEEKLRALELALVEDRHRAVELEVLAAGVEEIARRGRFAPARPDPTSVLGSALLVAERAARDEALGALMMEGSRAIYRESGRRRR